MGSFSLTCFNFYFTKCDLFEFFFKYYVFKKKVDYSFLSILSISVGASLSSAITSAYIANVNEHALKVIFILLILISFVKTLYNSIKNKQDFRAKKQAQEIAPIKLLLIGIFGGVISALSGLGGGIIFMPLMMLVSKAPLHLLILYSQSAICLGSFFSILTYLIFNNSLFTNIDSFWSTYYFPFIALVIMGSFLITPITSKIHTKLNPKYAPVIISLVYLSILASLV